MARDQQVQLALSQAYKDSVRVGPQEQAEFVYSVLKGRLGAAALGLKDTRTLQSWARGGPIKNSDHLHRLQLLYRVTTAIVRVYSPAVAAAFLRGSNPLLDHRAPMLVIGGSSPGDEAEREVVAAAEALLEG